MIQDRPIPLAALALLAVFLIAGCVRQEEPNRHLVIVLDGLRSDYITPDLMPNLYQLGREGVTAGNHHIVYPPVTRVNAPSIATGSYPASHGLMHNMILLPELSDEVIHTGDDIESLMAAAPLLTAVSIGERLQEYGRVFFTASSGSFGSSYLLNHTLAGAGVWNSRGLIVPEPMARHARQLLGELPEIDRPNVAQNRWVVDAYLRYSVDELDADVAILWITDPDGTAHTYGIGAPETESALAHVDEELGRLLDGLESRGVLSRTNIIVTTDHGFSTHRGGFQLARLLEEGGISDGVIVVGNSQIYRSGETAASAEEIARYLQERPEVGAIFSRPIRSGDPQGRVEGTLSMDLIHYTHERAADLLVTASWDDGLNEFGYAGRSAQGGTAGHGTASPFELRTTLILSGPDFREGVVSPVPTGNVDLAPTILSLLGVPLPESMQGRVLEELLREGPDPYAVEVQIERFETDPVGWSDSYRMVLERARTGESAYFMQAGIER